ncbi:MAG TPA: NADH-quinone oxidoreductase subunit C [Steroidobacteraceae bacterium]|nr:NADH-quinone oxidoreductase subunit C [Steroidobacteraceae bacterium]
MASSPLEVKSGPVDVLEIAPARWSGRAAVTFDSSARVCRMETRVEELHALCEWLTAEAGYVFATLVVEESPAESWSLRYLFYAPSGLRAEVLVRTEGPHPSVPSLSDLPEGPSYDWHEREAEDLFGVNFPGHPRLGDFVLHEDWPEGVNPMRASFDAARRLETRESNPRWRAPLILSSPGSFAMPIGPIFSDFAESSHFLLETVGEDVVRTVPRFFYKYRGLEKLAEGRPLDRVLLLAERFSGNAAFAHALALCEAAEEICGVEVPQRARVLRTVLAELERLRHHAATITGICHSTALGVAASQAALIEEDLLRLTCQVAGHRYLFGALAPGGLCFDPGEAQCERLKASSGEAAQRLAQLHSQLRYSSSFLDRLEEVGIVSREAALSYGLVGPIARASGVSRDLRKLCPYLAYETCDFPVAIQHEGDGYARLRVFFQEAQTSVAIIRELLNELPSGPVLAGAALTPRSGSAWRAVETPSGAAFHYLRLHRDGTVARYRVTPAAFVNWHGFHLAAENFAFQDFPIILASFGLSNAECDR